MEYPNPFWSSKVFKILIALYQFKLQLMFFVTILWCLSGPLVWQGSRRAPRRTSPGWTKPQQNRPSNLQVLCHIFTGQGAENSTGTTSDHWNSSICFWDSWQGGTDCNWFTWKNTELVRITLMTYWGLLLCTLGITCVCWQSWTKASQTVFTKAVAHARQPDSTLATNASTTLPGWWQFLLRCRPSAWRNDGFALQRSCLWRKNTSQNQFMLPFNLISTCGSKHSRKSTIKSPIIQQWWSIRQKHLLAFMDRQTIHRFSMWATKKNLLTFH